MKVYRCILPALLVAMAGWQASARTIPVPTQPVSPFADTEVSTNVALHLCRTDARDVQLHIQLDGTATNNLDPCGECPHGIPISVCSVYSVVQPLRGVSPLVPRRRKIPFFIGDFPPDLWYNISCPDRNVCLPPYTLAPSSAAMGWLSEFIITGPFLSWMFILEFRHGGGLVFCIFTNWYIPVEKGIARVE